MIRALHATKNKSVAIFFRDNLISDDIANAFWSDDTYTFKMS